MKLATVKTMSMAVELGSRTWRRARQSTPWNVGNRL